MGGISLPAVVVIGSGLVATRPLEKDNGASDVVNGVLFELPGCHRFFNHFLASTLQIVLVPERYNKVDDLLV